MASIVMTGTALPTDSKSLARRAPEVGRARGTLHLEVSEVPVSILSYRYALLAPPMKREELALDVASPSDPAWMKISAIAGRGAAKDFLGPAWLLEHGIAHGSLSALLALYQREFPVEDLGTRGPEPRAFAGRVKALPPYGQGFGRITDQTR